MGRAALQVLLDFTKWAFQSPEQREDILHQHALVAVQADASHRMAKVRCQRCVHAGLHETHRGACWSSVLLRGLAACSCWAAERGLQMTRRLAEMSSTPCTHT